MRCPKCLAQDTKVIDSRLLQDGDKLRRRRKCEVCEHRFSQKGDMNRHVAFIHGGKKSFKCDFCEYASSEKSNLKRHIANKHLVK